METVTIKLSRDQAEDLLRATNYLYMNYSTPEEWPDEELRRLNDECISRINNKVDDLRIIIKEAIKNG